MASDRIQRRIESLLDEADQAVAQGNWTIVRDCAEKVLAFNPDNSEAQAFLSAADRALPSMSPPVSEPSPSPITVSADLPASFANGRYQVKKLLGEGGKKKVYLAQDTLLDREIAFALIKTEGLDATSRERIQREAQAMGRLGSHSHIVTVFDLGEETTADSSQGQPYMVTEFMGGGDVEGMIENAADHRMSLEQAVNIAVATCRGLEFAHSLGIVHRDLKPGNVWLTGDGTAKIGDFGLAISLDRSRLTQEGMMVGTVSYMPPEQAMGGEVTSQSDLYSLGAMLYEMVTGRPPFLGDDAVAIIGQHINTPPVAPTWHNAQCPRALEALVMRLLAKDPRDRPGSTAEVLEALEAIDLTSMAEVPPGQEVQILDSLAGGVFVGRQREMDELKSALEDSLSGRGSLVTLVGEPGSGKTRTAQELATYAGLRQAQVLWGYCYEGEGAPPYWPWVQAIRSYVRERDPQQVSSEMGVGAADISEIVSDVREMLPDLKPPPLLEPEQARFRLFDSIATFLKNAGRNQPLALVLDDLHWADKSSLLLLEFIARELAGSRLLIIGTYRDVELNRQHPLAETLGELTRQRRFQRLLLRGLSQQDLSHFIEITEITSGVTPSDALVRAVHTETDGNPLFITEVVRLLVQEGELTTGGTTNRESWSVRIPEGVKEVVGRRLNRLSEPCNLTLTTASVIGREFSLAHLTRLAEDTSEDSLLEILEEALAARVIEELPLAVGRYQFTHKLVQETLADELSITRRVRLHARIAQVLEELYGDEAEAHAEELAYHYAQAEAVTGTEKLVHYSLLAGERALAAYGWEDALAHFERALAAKGVPRTGTEPANDAETAALLFGLGKSQAATLEEYQYQEYLPNFQRALDYYVQAADVSHALALAEYPIGTALVASGVAIGRTQLISQAMTLVDPNSQETSRLLPIYGLVLYQETADYQGAKEAFARCLAIAAREQDAALAMQTHAYASFVEVFHCHFNEAVEEARQAIQLADQVDDLRSQSLAHWCAWLALATLGNSEEAQGQAEAGLPPAESLRHGPVLGLALLAAGFSCKYLGHWQLARDYLERGLVASPQEPHLMCGSAVVEHQAGDFDRGREYHDRLLDFLVHSPGGGHEFA